MPSASARPPLKRGEAFLSERLPGIKHTRMWRKALGRRYIIAAKALFRREITPRLPAQRKPAG